MRSARNSNGKGNDNREDTRVGMLRLPAAGQSWSLRDRWVQQDIRFKRATLFMRGDSADANPHPKTYRCFINHFEGPANDPEKKRRYNNDYYSIFWVNDNGVWKLRIMATTDGTIFDFPEEVVKKIKDYALTLEAIHSDHDKTESAKESEEDVINGNFGYAMNRALERSEESEENADEPTEVEAAAD